MSKKLYNYCHKVVHESVQLGRTARKTKSSLDLIKTLSFDLAEEFSVNNVSKKLGVDRREMADYLKILQELNLFGVCYNHAFKSMRKKVSGSKKIYSLNLNLSLNINGFDESYLNDNRIFGKYFENYIYMRLLQNYGEVEYFRESGKEIDFITTDDAFEIKSGENIDITKYEELALRLKKKFNLISKNDAYFV